MAQPKSAGEDIIAKSLAKDIEVLVEPPEEEVAKGKRKPPVRGGKKETVIRSRKTKKPAAKPHGNPSLIYAVKVLKQTGKDQYNRPVYAIHLYVSGFDKDPILIFENLQSGAADVDVISLKNWGSAEFILEVIFSAKSPQPPWPAPPIPPVKTYLLFKGKKLVRRIPMKAGETFAFHGNGYFMKAKAMTFTADNESDVSGSPGNGRSSTKDWVQYKQDVEFRNIDGQVRSSPLEFFYEKKDVTSSESKSVTRDGFSSYTSSSSGTTSIFAASTFFEYVTTHKYEKFSFWLRASTDFSSKSNTSLRGYGTSTNWYNTSSASGSSNVESWSDERLTGVVMADTSDPRRGQNEILPASFFNTHSLATIRTDRRIIVSPTNKESLYLLSRTWNQIISSKVEAKTSSSSTYRVTPYTPPRPAFPSSASPKVSKDEKIHKGNHCLVYRTANRFNQKMVVYLTPGLPETKRPDGTFDDRVVKKNDFAAYFMTTYRQKQKGGTPPEYIGDRLQGLINHAVAIDVFSNKVFRIMASKVMKTGPSKGWWDDGEYKDLLFEHKGKTHKRLKLVDRVATEKMPFKVTVEVYGGRTGDNVNGVPLNFAGTIQVQVYPFKPKEKVVEKAPATVLPTQDGYVEWRVSHYSFCQSPVRYKIKKNPKDKAGTI